MLIYQDVGTGLLRKEDGARCSQLLIVAPMPTASTLKFGEQRSFEPYTSNIYRRVLSGEFMW
jgi:hypothetical protein